jgi:hypothetical protein
MPMPAFRMKQRPACTCLGQLVPAAILALALASTARAADVSPADQAASAALFDEGMALFEQGKPKEALAKFLASQRLEPTIGALLNIARCHEALGHFASAWGAFDEAEGMATKAGDEERRAHAAQKKEALAPKIARLRVEVDQDAHATAVRLDGKPLPEGALGAALPLDPGEHVLEADREGTAPFRTTVRITQPGTVQARVTAAPKIAAPEAAPYWNGQRVAAVSLGGAGIAGVVVGAVFGVRAGKDLEASRPHCKDLNPDPCDAEGVALRDRASTGAWVSDLGIGLGAAAIVGGVVLFATAPAGRPAAAPSKGGVEITPIVAGSRAGGFLLRGRF